MRGNCTPLLFLLFLPTRRVYCNRWSILWLLHLYALEVVDHVLLKPLLLSLRKLLFPNPFSGRGPTSFESLSVFDLFGGLSMPLLNVYLHMAD